MSFGYLNFIHFSGTCNNSSGKAAKPVGTWTFILEGTEVSGGVGCGPAACAPRQHVQRPLGRGTAGSPTGSHKEKDRSRVLTIPLNFHPLRVPRVFIWA